MKQVKQSGLEEDLGDIWLEWLGKPKGCMRSPTGKRE